MDNALSLFPRGTFQASATEDMRARRTFAPDKDWTAGANVVKSLSAHDVEVWYLKNATGAAVLPGVCYKLDWDLETDQVLDQVKAVAGSGEVADVVADEYLPAAGCPDGSSCWFVRRGPGKLKTSTATQIDGGDYLKTAAAGKVVEDTTPGTYSQSTFARSLAQVAAADTLFRVYIFGTFGK